VCYHAYDSSQPDASELIPAVKRLPERTRDADSQPFNFSCRIVRHFCSRAFIILLAIVLASP
jgi:hypothetical protein